MTKLPSATEQKALDDAEAAWFEWRDAHKDWPPFEIFRAAYCLGFAVSESEGSARNELLRTLKLRCGYIINGYSDAKMEAVEMERLINEHFAAPSPSSNNSGGG